MSTTSPHLGGNDIRDARGARLPLAHDSYEYLLRTVPFKRRGRAFVCQKIESGGWTNSEGVRAC